jgi:ATP-dependent DNA ligase
VDADFMQPMECLPVSKLPDGPNWLWEIKLHGYRVIAVKNSGNLSLWSRNRKSLNRQFLQIVEALKELPDGTVVDGRDGRRQAELQSIAKLQKRSKENPIFRV